MQNRCPDRVPIERVEVSAFTVPTETLESDGTYEWSSTTLVIVEAFAAGKRSLGYSYADAATASLIKDSLSKVVLGRDSMDVGDSWRAMVDSVRNIGSTGIAAMAISAVDNALWDLKARVLNLSLVNLLGARRSALPIYGSGGFTSYTREQLKDQLAAWVAAGIPRVKMKVGRAPHEDLSRVRAAREAITENAELFLDANGAYGYKQALKFAQEFGQLGVTWFEEPVPSDNLDGLRRIRDRSPAGMEINRRRVWL